MPEIVYARARPRELKITETYTYKHELARQPGQSELNKPEGKIEITIPYDGYHSFHRHAFLDVKKQAKQRRLKAGPLNACIGHLAFTNYKKIDLSPVKEFIPQFDTLPLNIQARGKVFKHLEQLCEDQYSAVLKFEYLPASPEVNPVELRFQLLDEDLISVAANGQSPQNLKMIADKISRQVHFLPFLLLEIEVRLNLPHKLPADSKPKITQFALKWPIIPSPDSFELKINPKSEFVENYSIGPHFLRDEPIRYNPVNASLEWKNVAFNASEVRTKSGFETYTSEKIYLEIKQPEVFFEKETLSGQLKIEIPGYLLSNLQTRLFNARGKLTRTPTPALKTELKLDFTLNLGDIFAHRKFTPYYQFQFDEIVLDEMRVANIHSTLSDRGFQINQEKKLESNDTNHTQYIILASRIEGPHTFDLWIVLDGEPIETERKAEIKGGTDYKSKFDSGRMKVYVRGQAKTDYRLLWREINTVQTVLCECFECIRARR